MPALFPPWANTATHVALAVLGLGAAAVVVLPMIYARSPLATGVGEPVPQPILFDHRHHVRDDGIACLYCHDGAERSPVAGIPSTDRCLGCHAQIWSDSAAVAPLYESARTGQPIRWRKVHALPDFVYFDHSVHVRRGVGCATCHGRVEDMAAVVQVAPLTMQWCVDCHREQERAITHCSTCHR